MVSGSKRWMPREHIHLLKRTYRITDGSAPIDSWNTFIALVIIKPISLTLNVDQFQLYTEKRSLKRS